jgi:hypothetical protein
MGTIPWECGNFSDRSRAADLIVRQEPDEDEDEEDDRKDHDVDDDDDGNSDDGYSE